MQLTAEHKTKIKQLSKHSGYSLNECKHYLSLNDWDLKKASIALTGGRSQTVAVPTIEDMSLKNFYSRVNMVKKPIRTFQCAFYNFSDWLETEKNNVKHGLDLNPDFQRGHVWTEAQQTKYIENIFRKLVDQSGLTLRFNCPTWRDDMSDGDLKDQIICIDGLQRMQAILKFTQGDLRVYGYLYQDLPRRIKIRELYVNIQMFDFQNRKDLLEYYLDINAGGTPHSAEEIERVTALYHQSLKVATD